MLLPNHSPHLNVLYFQDRMKLQQVRLMVELFESEQLSFHSSTRSQVVTNSKSKECGPMRIHEVHPLISCCRSQTKICVISDFKLVADVRANFILYDPEAKSIVYNTKFHDLMRKINQPEDCTVFNQTVLFFKAPEQNYDVIQEVSATYICNNSLIT